MAIVENLSFGSPGTGVKSIGSPRLNTPEVGFDSLQQKYLIEAAVADLPARLDALLPKGGVHADFGSMYITDRGVPMGVGDWWEVEVDFKGLLSPKPYKRAETSYSEQSSGESVDIGASLQAQGYPALAGRLQAMQAAVSTITSYVSLTKPVSADVGEEVVIGNLPAGYPAFPAPPASIWDYITDPTWIYPKGWVLDRRDPEQIAGANIWFVVDHHVFHQMAQL